MTAAELISLSWADAADFDASAALRTEADAAGLPLRVSALRKSASNRFYLRHGFEPAGEGEWDLYYVRPALPRTTK